VCVSWVFYGWVALLAKSLCVVFDALVVEWLDVLGGGVLENGDESWCVRYARAFAMHARMPRTTQAVLHTLNHPPPRHQQPPETKVYVRAGPRRELHFDPTKVKAAIVTCGGLCPGLNNVIRELVNSLFHLYKADTIYGIRCVFFLGGSSLCMQWVDLIRYRRLPSTETNQSTDRPTDQPTEPPPPKTCPHTGAGTAASTTSTGSPSC
jgi:predicted metal-binding protein